MTQDTTSENYRELKAELRSILISSQQGLTEQLLMKDYGAFNAHKDIPFRAMGYRSLIDLLMTMPDVARLDRTRLPILIHGVADQNTVHIQKMVSAQKRKKKPANMRQNFHQSYYTTSQIIYNSTAYPRVRSNVYSSNPTFVPLQPLSQFNNALKPDSESADLMNKSATNSKMVASFPPKSTPTPPLMSSSDIASMPVTSTFDDSPTMVDDDLNYSADDELAAYDAQRAMEYGDNIIALRKQIRQLLLQFPKGIWLTSVRKLYQKKFNEELQLDKYKLKTLMAFLDCVSDFVDASRVGQPDSVDRFVLLKSNFIDVSQREAQSQQTIVETNEKMTSLSNGIQRPIVDRSSFVSLDFQYRTIDYVSNEPFIGFLGDVEDPWNIHLGNAEFIPKRDQMMTELQEHYKQYSDQMIYLIPFEQIRIHLCCIYYHSDRHYYRAFIYHIDPTVNTSLLILKLYLVDFGYIIPNVSFHVESTDLKFLHQSFSTLATQVYDCRLANVTYPLKLTQWSDNVKQIIVDLCENVNFYVEFIGTMDGFYLIYLWHDIQNRQSINEFLVKKGLARQTNDAEYQHFESIIPQTNQSYKMNSSSNDNKYVNEKCVLQTNLNYNLEENHIKHFRISIQHEYYFIKHPYTKRPCLPCFELARLLNKDENFISHLNLIRATELPLDDSYKSLYDQLINIDEARQCSHLHGVNRNTPKIFIYDLSSIGDYLCKIKYNDGDVRDAFQNEYENYERPGYWNENQNSHITENNLQTHEDILNQQHNVLNFRKAQLLSLSKQTDNHSIKTELLQVGNKLQTIEQELTQIKHMIPSTNNDNQRIQSKLSKKKMRDTLFRIARPFDQQFSLNICFNHQYLTNEQIDDEIDERFLDLARIMKNILQFFLLESDLFTNEHQQLFDQANDILPYLINNQDSLKTRTDAYNYCLEIVGHLQPIIRSYVQRTDLIDTIY